MSIPSFSPETQSALKILDAVVKVFTNNGNLEPLVIAIKNNPKLFLGWHVSLLILLFFFCMFTFHFFLHLGPNYNLFSLGVNI